ncbi:hypothetical protein [Solimonas marina]|uniref:Uncharacterized protein n=1 Tax=Solimonas marina TaxID=2714601 RepID=A0A969WA92_9GAMM|nr:hypothetical protein [Solimonas marina]NKF22873.1 hypothetical protein [Solimonas marina]
MSPKTEFSSKVLVSICVSLKKDIDDVRSLGSGWENWLQIEIARALEKAGTATALEKKYLSSTYDRERYADLEVQHKNKRYYVELKAERMSHVGRAFERECQSTLEIIGGAALAGSGESKSVNIWALFVARSPERIANIKSSASSCPNIVLIEEGPNENPWIAIFAHSLTALG